MKAIITIIATAAAMLAAVAVYGQPKTKLLPDETVLLYADAFNVTNDPVHGDKIVCAGFEMAEKNGLEGEENHPENGNIGNISDYARVDLYFPKKANGQMIVVCPGGGYSIVSS